MYVQTFSREGIREKTYRIGTVDESEKLSAYDQEFYMKRIEILFAQNDKLTTNKD